MNASPSRLRCALLAALLLAAPPLFAAAASAAPNAQTADGGRYFGPLVDGRMHGKGRLEYASGAYYEGGFARGVFSGQGSLRQPSGVRYEGQFRQGAFDGQGRYTSPKGEVYAGTFVNGNFDGAGSYRGPDGGSYVGTFRNWKPHGAGILTDSDGVVFKGKFAQGQPQGPMQVKTPDGIVYEGELKDWKFDGVGVLRTPDGDRYEGHFSNGLFDGAGVLHHADGRASDSGNWVEGQLDDPAADKLTRDNIELALYGQQALLERSLANVLPRDPAKAINLYLLAVGGDGAQEVFRRETAFVQQQFDRDYGTLGRSLALVNSRNTVAQQPMATRTSIRTSLDALGAKMNTQQDILFLFLTSHGSPGHELALAQNGMDLHNLPATELAAMLKHSAIRWKVIVISACYAGGFIDALKDDNTLIITAARADRTSFGCDDQNDFTYFSEAYFKQALPGSSSFAAAFDTARALVRAREKADFQEQGLGEEEHSEPQIYQGKAIGAQLKAWREQNR
ncbi:C13 family peptidase [Janthinobacterium aquaticum]|uniref:C13 family peptidase n=1 Tax=Janthinobacterium sp. FT58W TaxID=2654254 RepID=UPI00126596BE|nr:C13 family peptidase [Janthinobacterium sp. FT58W]KAB8042083.1 peptidase C13 [Janthinobacterium sp. FT58W]